MQLYTSLVVLFLMTLSAVLWIVAKPVIRPKYNGVQTLVGGCIWSQLMLNVGDIITHVAKPNPYKVVFIYFLVCSNLLVTGTAVVLITQEIQTMYPEVVHTRTQSRVRMEPSVSAAPTRQGRRMTKMHKTYIAITILLLLASAVLEFRLYEASESAHSAMALGFIVITGLLAFGAYWTTKYILTMPESGQLYSETASRAPAA